MRSEMISFKYLRDGLKGLVLSKETEDNGQGDSVGLAEGRTEDSAKTGFESRKRGSRNTAQNKENWGKVRGNTEVGRGIRVYNSIEWAELQLNKQPRGSEEKRALMRFQQKTLMGIEDLWRNQDSKAKYQKFLQSLADSNAEIQRRQELAVERPALLTQATQLDSQDVGSSLTVEAKEHCPVPVLRKLYKARKRRE